MLDRFKRAWHAFKDTPVDSFKMNHQHKVFTDQSREWLDIGLAPHGVKIHALTREGMPTHTILSERTVHLFKGFEPLPSTPHWMKEMR